MSDDVAETAAELALLAEADARSLVYRRHSAGVPVEAIAHETGLPVATVAIYCRECPAWWGGESELAAAPPRRRDGRTRLAIMADAAARRARVIALYAAGAPFAELQLRENVSLWCLNNIVRAAAEAGQLARRGRGRRGSR